MTEILFKQEVYQIIGAAMEVYNEHGSGFPEPVYQESMEIELGLRNLPFKSQPQLSLCYKGQRLKKHFVPDLLIYDQIIVELKVMETLTNRERKQLYHYLKSSDYQLGLLINFGSENKVEWERIVWSRPRNGVQYDF